MSYPAINKELRATINLLLLQDFVTHHVGGRNVAAAPALKRWVRQMAENDPGWTNVR